MSELSKVASEGFGCICFFVGCPELSVHEQSYFNVLPEHCAIEMNGNANE